MNPVDAAERSLREGDPAEALTRLQEAVRARPGDAGLRIFLFQLLCVTGQWERALNQLQVVAGLDAGTLAMVQAYREAIHCEVLRAQVFKGSRTPMVLGQPEAWLAWLIEAVRLDGGGKPEEAAALRARAFEEAQGTGGMLDGQSFAWIMDADSRLGPVCEIILNGRYYWVPFSRFSRIAIDPPEDLRDVVWMPGHVRFDNGGECVALIPARYAGSETSGDGQLLLARKTTWAEVAPGVYHGAGQRTLATDAGEYPLMDIRQITFGASAADPGEPAVPSRG